MRRDTLLDFFEDFSTQPDTFIVHDDGYRVRRVTYQEVGDAARRFSEKRAAAGGAASDKVVIWSENRAEWIIAMWGCLLRGAVIVPVDYRASGDLLLRISGIVKAKLVLVGEEGPPAGVTGRVWKLTESSGSEVRGSGVQSPRFGVQSSTSAPRLTPTSLAEIIFTSGATAEPKGVTITHRNVLANIIPIEREIAKYRKYERPFHPLRFLNLLPLSHMFGQSMATFVPPMLAGTVVFSHGYSPVGIVRQIKSRRISRARVRAEGARRPAGACRAHRAALADPIRFRASTGRIGGGLLPDPSNVRLEVLGNRLRCGAARARAGSVLAQARLPRGSGLRPDGDGAGRHAQSSVPRSRGTGYPHRRVEVNRSRRRISCWRERHLRLLQAGRRRRRPRESDAAFEAAGSTPATSAHSTNRPRSWPQAEMIAAPGAECVPETPARLIAQPGD
jgi:hypothetical protein